MLGADGRSGSLPPTLPAAGRARGWRHRRLRSKPRAIVVFIDDGPWTSFNQMATRIRRNRCKTLRVTSNGTLRSRWPNILLYDLSYVAPQWSHIPRIDDLVRRGSVVDIQCPEQLLHIAELLVRDSKSVTLDALRRLHTRMEFGDKLTATERLDENGVRVPSYLDASTSSVDVAIELLGFPLVMKPRRGSSGIGTTIARDVTSARLAAKSLSIDDALYEEFVGGQRLAFCAVFREGAVVQESALKLVRYNADSLGPSDSLITIDDEAIFAVGRKVISIIGGSGLVELDILRDQSGNDYVIDTNLRAWASIGALLMAGVDFTAGYLNVIGVTSASPSASRAEPGVNISYSLFLRNEDANKARSLSAVVWFVAASARRIRYFGLRYWLNGLLTHVSGGFRERRFRKAN